MQSRERVLSALAHREPDRIPIDFGSTPVTGIHASVVAALREHYGLERRPVKVHEPYQMLALIEDDLQQALGIDTEGVFARDTLFGFPNEGWRPWRTPWGQELLVSQHFRTTQAPSGDVLIHPQGDVAAEASGRMPASGYFFDAIVRQPPLDEDRLDPEDNMEEFQPIAEEALAHLRREVSRARASGRAVVASFGGTAFGDIALVPGLNLKQPRGIRDIAEWYISTAARRPYVHAVFERQCEVGLANLARIHAAVGDGVDAVFVCGTDFGTQTSSFCSVATLRELWLPYYRRVNDWIHANTSWRSFKHSCGAVEKFVPSFIEAGFDILNPVQCSAAGMDPQTLKSRHGERIVFWGGGVDTQSTLPFGTPDAVRREVEERCRIFGRGGGFVFNTVHNVQAGTPIENVVAMVETVRRFS
ncbi:MAG TPA: uroporphyrinogen decarboxylase family protein [Vicinamibacteria bacterium]|nr:uroporphyrinogen decarboxylase family protein [Vicinamibacteria bacterium]